MDTQEFRHAAHLLLAVSTHAHDQNVHVPRCFQDGALHSGVQCPIDLLHFHISWHLMRLHVASVHLSPLIFSHWVLGCHKHDIHNVQGSPEVVQSEHKRQVRSMRAVRCKEDLGLLVKTAASGAHDAQRGAAHTQCVVTDTAQHIQLLSLAPKVADDQQVQITFVHELDEGLACAAFALLSAHPLGPQPQLVMCRHVFIVMLQMLRCQVAWQMSFGAVRNVEDSVLVSSLWLNEASGDMCSSFRHLRAIHRHANVEPFPLPLFLFAQVGFDIV
mmetsp:Transcript_14196/g.38495  ORF Transcript_14196/g.38495 Transcript_14196/m.38495 type:complete len:273 (-) Transcript_14196:58-876(-)